MHNFKPGDLALTLINLGRLVPAGSVVELIRPFAKGDVLMDLKFHADAWECSKPDLGKGLFYAEKHLMPLRGELQPEQQKSREVEHG